MQGDGKKFEVGIEAIAGFIVDALPGYFRKGEESGYCVRTVHRQLEAGVIPSEPREGPRAPYQTHVDSLSALGSSSCDLFGVKAIAEHTGYGIRQTKTHIKTGWFPVDRTVSGHPWSTQSSLDIRRKK